jgi:hypothetical protein
VGIVHLKKVTQHSPGETTKNISVEAESSRDPVTCPIAKKLLNADLTYSVFRAEFSIVNIRGPCLYQHFKALQIRTKINSPKSMQASRGPYEI